MYHSGAQTKAALHMHDAEASVVTAAKPGLPGLCKHVQNAEHSARFLLPLACCCCLPFRSYVSLLACCRLPVLLKQTLSAEHSMS